MPPEKSPLDFEAIYREHYKSIYNYIYARILQREAAEDLAADVFVAAAVNLDRIVLGKSGIAPWLFKVARNMALNYCLCASTRLEESCGTLPEQVAHEMKAWDDSLREPDSPRVERILRALSDEERDFLELRYAMGFSNEEIAQRENISTAAVSQRYHRLLAKCRKLEKGE